MARYAPPTVIPAKIRNKPLQAGKFGGILLALVLGIAGFFRIIDASAMIDDPLVADGQFLALLLLPLVSLLLVCIVSLEAVVAGYRLVRGEGSVTADVDGGTGYLVLRAAEAGIALLGVTIMLSVLPTLFADSTPAPAGVGALLLLMVVGLAILITSFVRSAVELWTAPGEPV